MIKRLTALLFALGTLPVLAQQTPKPDPTQVYSLLDGKTILKTNPFSDIFGNLNLKVERIITDGLSAQLSVFASPKANQGRQFGAFHDITSVTSSIALYSFQPKYVAIVPQVRWYLNDGLGYGFYMQAYYHYQHTQFTNQEISAHRTLIGNNTPEFTLVYDGQATMHGFGFGIGAQWLFGRRKNVVLDWYIAGIGRGFVRGKLTGSYTSALDQQSFTERIREELPNQGEGTEFSFDATQPRVKVSKIKYQSYILDMGLSIGFRF